jgi:hypothetical protein
MQPLRVISFCQMTHSPAPREVVTNPKRQPSYLPRSGHFNVPCFTLEEFMEEEGWQF